MLSKNQIAKYFYYAFGEIILVVIGILIALQINNWNEQNKNSEAELSFYQDVLVDLENDEQNIHKLTVFYQNRIDQLGWLLDAVRNPKTNPDIIEFGKHVEPLYYNLDDVQYASSFEAAKSSGAFSIFKNKEILKNLTQFYSEYGSIQGILRATLDIINDQLEPIMSTIPENYLEAESSELVLAKIDYNNEDFYNYLDQIGDSRDLKIDLSAFLQKPEFENYLIGDLGRCFNGMRVFSNRLKTIQIIKSQITTYLSDSSI
jgi:hypothetical protein